ncbi:MAG TPA: FdrA family protein [Streptosporangiaceae bacterium]|nr:FdrA family protein [Streptosporangiaceae bacterium]
MDFVWRDEAITGGVAVSREAAGTGRAGAEHVQARPGAYADSVTLMQVSAQAQAVDGVRAALVAMATDLNLRLLDGLGLAAPPGVGEHDLLVAIKADDGMSLAAALAVVEAGLENRSAQPGAEDTGREFPPRTTSSAIARSGPGIVLVSVPGQYACTEAMDALARGCDVMIFSDNVSVAEEIALKDHAAERGLLVMGPDCGTAIVGGVGLGFANSVRRGPIGLVAASGTGAQQLSCLLDAAGSGCSAVLGLGGRDLSAAVGGRSARAALAALDADPDTELIVLLSKPPDARVAHDLRSYADTLSTKVQFALVGRGQPDLTRAAETALAAIGCPAPDWPRWTPVDGSGPSAGAPRGGGALRGLFAGGTLCDEAMIIAAGALGPVYSNVPLEPGTEVDPRLPASERPPEATHVMIDFGADELTTGRPHPMIDQRLRLDQLALEAADPATAVIMLDVVLGFGAHADPAADLAPAIAAARSRHGGQVVVSLVGTPADPQGLDGQAAAFVQAGAHVFASNAQAARFACELIAGQAGGVR